ncbi:MAG: DUF1858 domain-containing protein [Sedimentibacter sp.]|uniref:DUF1858 domain-containing protein n=1 Tax=Sedimentibacter sp. TaxID=1960295 RepID=UPI00315864A2
MNKVIDLSRTVYELCKEYPEIKDILAGIGFSDIMKKGMIETAGRFMTIQKGSKARGIDLGKIKQEFIKNGFEIK